MLAFARSRMLTAVKDGVLEQLLHVKEIKDLVPFCAAF